MTHITCRLTAKNRDQLRKPTLCNRVWATFTFYLHRARSMIITLISADIGQSDVDLGDRVLFNEVDEPPWRGPGALGTRVRVRVIVDSQASIQICAHLNRILVARQASVC